MIGFRAALGSRNKADNTVFILLNVKTVDCTQSLEIPHSLVLANPAEMQCLTFAFSSDSLVLSLIKPYFIPLTTRVGPTFHFELWLADVSAGGQSMVLMTPRL